MFSKFLFFLNPGWLHFLQVCPPLCDCQQEPGPLTHQLRSCTTLRIFWWLIFDYISTAPLLWTSYGEQRIAFCILLAKLTSSLAGFHTWLRELANVLHLKRLPYTLIEKFGNASWTAGLQLAKPLPPLPRAPDLRVLVPAHSVVDPGRCCPLWVGNMSWEWAPSRATV